MYDFKRYDAMDLHAIQGPVVRAAAPAQLCGSDYRILLFLSSLQPYISEFWTIAFKPSHFLAPFTLPSIHVQYCAVHE